MLKRWVLEIAIMSEQTIQNSFESQRPIHSVDFLIQENFPGKIELNFPYKYGKPTLYSGVLHCQQ